jgi:hypothetical protein
MKQLDVIICKPGLPGYIDTVENELHALQEVVDGYIEPVRIGNDLVILCNEEGILRSLPLNRIVNGCMLCGTFLVVGEDGEEFVSLTQEQMRYWFACDTVSHFRTEVSS